MSMQSVSVVDQVKSHVADHKDHAIAATVFALLARPAYNFVKQWMDNPDQMPYSLQSLLGYKCGIKPETDEFDEQFRGQLSVGSADFTLKTPTNLKAKAHKMVKDACNITKCLCGLKPKPKPKQKKSLEDFQAFVNDFYPKLMVALEDQTSPVVRDKEAGVESKSKRLCAKFSCGQFELRSGVDLSEAVMVPVSMIASYVLYQMSQYFKTKTN